MITDYELNVVGAVRCLQASLPAEKLLSSDQKRAAMAERHPLKRVGIIDDIASLAEILLTDRASWITGQVIGVDGGMSRLRI
jgi:NAD(P)-dependent dehydrogenase (short-subunit alcohol dehydrogenase family)